MSEQLERSLSYPTIFIITLTSIIGTGVFFLPAIGARETGPASIISWTILAGIAIYVSTVFGELTSMFPNAGGVYEFCKQAFGRFPSFIIGWIAILAGNVTISMLIVGAIQYLMPQTGMLNLLGFIFDAKYFKLAVCIFFILIFNYITFRGIEVSATMLVSFGVITLSTLVALIIPGLFSFNISSFNLSSSGDFNFMPGGIFSIFVGIYLVVETFFGWESATFLAGETKNGEKVMPKAMFYSTIFIAIICLLLVITAFGNMPWDVFGSSRSPLSDLGAHYYGDYFGNFFVILVYISIIGSVAAWIVSAPRLLLAMAEDKLLLGQFKAIHPVNKTPYKAIFFQTILTTTIVIIGFESYEFLLHMLVPLATILYCGVMVSLLLLRKTKPDHPRYMRVPYAKFGIPFVLLFLLALMFIWASETHGAWNTLAFCASLVALGLPLYMLVELYYNPKAIIKANDFFAKFALFTEKISIPKWVKEKIFLLVGDLNGKSVLEYGCNVGTLTIPILKKIGPHGRLYATDISLKNLQITQSRIKKHQKRNSHLPSSVKIIHDMDQMIRIHPSIPYSDVIISFGMLSYVQNLNKVLDDLHSILPEGGQICLVEFADYFKVIPNVDWLSTDEEVKKLFSKSGFSIRVVREKGLLWNYVFVYGIKSKNNVPFI
jgi:basic amino acid/polyamine antiporter, APA family